MKKLIVNMDTAEISYYANFYARQYRISKQEAGEKSKLKRNVLYFKIQEYNRVLEQRGFKKIKV